MDSLKSVDTKYLSKFQQTLEAEGPSALALRRFRQGIWQFYQDHGRSHPWRETRSPYRILVSEFMLQQTQVNRVLPKYRSFLNRFPSMRALAQAPLAEVLVAWQGLGYNRRGAALQRCCGELLSQHQGKLPEREAALQSLPGIGPYTAAALRSFVHNKPSVMVETNIRAVILHHFFPRRKKVSEEEVREFVERTMCRRNPRDWYYAMMDYGAHLKASGIKTNQRVRGYRPQSRFEGSNRQLRGAIVRYLTQHQAVRITRLQKELPFQKDQIQQACKQLEQEGLLESRRGMLRLPR